MQNVVARLDADSAIARRLRCVAGAPFLRRQMFVSCAGENAQVHLSGATLLRAREHADTTLTLDA